MDSKFDEIPDCKPPNDERGSGGGVEPYQQRSPGDNLALGHAKRALNLYRKAIRCNWPITDERRADVLKYAMDILISDPDPELKMQAMGVLLKADASNISAVKAATAALAVMKDCEAKSNQTVNIYNQTNIRVAMTPADTAREYLDAISDNAGK